MQVHPNAIPPEVVVHGSADARPVPVVVYDDHPSALEPRIEVLQRVGGRRVDVHVEPHHRYPLGRLPRYRLADVALDEPREVFHVTQVFPDALEVACHPVRLLLPRVVYPPARDVARLPVRRLGDARVRVVQPRDTGARRDGHEHRRPPSPHPAFHNVPDNPVFLYVLDRVPVRQHPFPRELRVRLAPLVRGEERGVDVVLIRALHVLPRYLISEQPCERFQELFHVIRNRRQSAAGLPAPQRRPWHMPP